MLEYRLVVQRGKGRPYSLWTFNNFDSCYAKLIEMINTQSLGSNNFYYVLNKFFRNTYLPVIDNTTYYTIECREVTNWRIYEKEKEETKGKIISMFKRG